jgi:hypothetical protein
MHIFAPEMHESIGGRDFTPEPTAGAYDSPPDPPLVFGLRAFGSLKVRKGKKRERKARKGMEGKREWKGEGKGTEGNGREGNGRE